VAIIPKEDLAKSGYKPKNQLQIFNRPPIFWLHTHKQVQKSGIITFLYFHAFDD
jgi:hypothetical protein